MKKISIGFIFMLAFIFAYAQAGKTIRTKAHQNLSCASCHNTDKPERRAPVSACNMCHGNSGGTYKGKLDKDGKPVRNSYLDGSLTREMNFHDSHQGDIRCTICHTTHAEPPKLYCNDCHSFKVELN